MIHIAWADDRKCAVHWRFEGPWTSNEFFEATRQAEALFVTVNHKVHGIIEFEHNTSFPVNVLKIARYGFSIPSMSNPNVGFQIFVKPPSYVLVILDILGKVYPDIRHAVRTVDSLSLARELAAKER